MTDYFATYYGDMTGYMPDCTETYVIDLIKQQEKQTNNDAVFSKMGINIPNFCTNGVDVRIDDIENVVPVVFSMSASGQYLTTLDLEGIVYTSSNYGANWTQRTQLGGIFAGVSISASGQYQTAVSHYAETAGFIYISSDYGVTWTQTNQRDYWTDVSISASGQYQTAVSHVETAGFIYISSDYGVTWTQTNQRDYWRGVSISASGQYQTAVSHSAETAGFIYISSDYGVTWTQTNQRDYWTDVSISASGQYQTSTALYYGPQTPYQYIYISSDYGVTWNKSRTDIGIPPTYAFDPSADVAISATGQYQIVGGSVNLGLPDKLYSTDYGATWVEFGTPQRCVSISASGQFVAMIPTDGINGLTIYNNSGFLNLSNVKPTPPSTSKGSTGDVVGMMAVNDEYLYYCSDTYTDGADDIWKRIAWSGGVWP